MLTLLLWFAIGGVIWFGVSAFMTRLERQDASEQYPWDASDYYDDDSFDPDPADLDPVGYDPNDPYDPNRPIGE